MIIGSFDIFKKELQKLFFIVRETPPSRGNLVRPTPTPQSQRCPLINIFAFDPLDNQPNSGTWSLFFLFFKSFLPTQTYTTFTLKTF